jgi:hypothetical protein
MRQMFAGILILMCVFILGAVSAAENQMGIRDNYQVNFSEKVRVADTLLPQGNYEIRHVMEGSDHIMVFRQLGTKKPVEVRAKCTLVPLSAKADKNQTIYILNAANERVLQELVFKGDLAKHVF